MTDEVTGPHSKAEAEGAWNNDNPDDKIDRNLPVWYDLDKYVIRRVKSNREVGSLWIIKEMN